jgi:hydrogenase maturation protein HypF
MPFHYLIFRKIETPAVVLTSGNYSDEPIITDDHLAEEKLMPVADGIISYNRQILNRVDDSVVRISDKKLRLIRRSRGFVPRPVDLNRSVEGILALGAEEKSCFCIGKGSQAVMSQYIGDLKNQATFDFFTESIERFSKLFRFIPEVIACDLHPDYLSTMYAELLEKKLSIPLVRVQHHHAHIVSCMAEHKLEDEVIGVSLDGTGLGSDGNIWGSEFMIAGLKEFRRISHFEYVPLPGGEKAVYQPWRTALAYIYMYYGDDFDYTSLSLFKVAGAKKVGILKEMIKRGVNSPLSSGAGRLFDAVAALLGLCVTRTFDAEGPMRLECAINDTTDDYYPFTTGDSIGFGDTFREIISDLRAGKGSLIPAKFHNTVAQVILETVLKIKEETSLKTVILSGGVFQNKYLLEKTSYLLKMNKFRVFTNSLVPSNDGGISLGQLIIASKSK